MTAIVNVHREGTLCVPTLHSVVNAANLVRASGHTVEVLVIADKPDVLTRAVAREFSARTGVSYIEVEEGDLGRSRNFAIAAASGNYIAFMDGDDLCSEDWFASGLALASQSEKFIIHPEINYIFGENDHIMLQPDQQAGDLTLNDLAMNNCWTALNLAHSKVFDTVQYVANRLGAGYGFEDWNWNLRTWAAGFIHRVAPGSAHFIRRKRVSLLKESIARGVIVEPIPIRSLLSRFPAS